MTSDKDKNNDIPEAWRELNPLITDKGYALLDRIKQHRHAPRWNEVVGDHIVAEDLEAVDAFRKRVRDERSTTGRTPSGRVLNWVEQMRDRSLLFREHIPEGMNLDRDWAHVPTMGRRWMISVDPGVSRTPPPVISMESPNTESTAWRSAILPRR